MRSLPALKVKFLILSAISALLFTASAFGQSDADKPGVVVIPFNESGRATYGGAELAAMLNKELAKSGKFSVIDRSGAAAIEAEIKKGPKDVIDLSTAAEIGRKTGAQFLVLGTVMDYAEKVKSSFVGTKSYEANVKFSLRVVNASNAAVVFTQTFEKSGVSMGEAKNITGSFGSKAMQDCVNKSIKDAVAALVKHLASTPATK